MTGLLLLVVMVVWLVVVNWIGKFVTTKLPERWWRTPARVLILVALLPLPLVDEIIGGRQFEQLCKENSTIQVDRVKAVGKTVYLNSLPETNVQGTWVPISVHYWRFVDATTGELVVSYNTLRATGGRLIRALGISEGNVPLTFKSSCEPKGSPASIEAFENFGITYIEPPIKKNGEKNDNN